MILKADLHIHTSLSPCGDEDMTPNNIVNMAKLKGLDVIGITDHNSVENVRACMEVGKREGVLVIPGMELQTREDVHAICLFENLVQAEEFQKLVYGVLPNLENNEKLFGEQLVINSNDEIMGRNSRLLLTSANLSFDDAFYEVLRLGGTFIPAHIDKSANGVIANLGFIPNYLDIKTLEYREFDKVQGFIKTGLLENKYRFIKSSDAHYLEDILEDENHLECEAKNIGAVISKLKQNII